MQATNAKILTDYLLKKHETQVNNLDTTDNKNTNRLKNEEKIITKDSITGYPNEIYNPIPLQNNPNITPLQWSIKELVNLTSSNKSIMLPMKISKIESVLNKKPQIEKDEDFPEYTTYLWKLSSGLVLTAVNSQKTNNGWQNGWIIIGSEKDKTIKGLPFDFVLNESSIQNVENKLSKFKTQKLGNSIEFRLGTVDYKFEFNTNKTLDRIHIKLN